MSDDARQRYLTTHIATIANEVRHGLQAIPENFEGISAITATLDAFEHHALLDPRGTRTAAEFIELKGLCRRFRANVYPEMLEAGFRAIQNTPPSEEDARERDRVRAAYMEQMRDEYAEMSPDWVRANAVPYHGWMRDDEAEKRGMDLLRDNLSEPQRNELEQHGWFHVIGNSSKKTFRLFKARQMNIMELDKSGGPKWCWCFLPSGGVVLGDVLLAQKLALETDEKAALKLANRFAPNMCQGSQPWVPSDRHDDRHWRDLYNAMHVTPRPRWYQRFIDNL
jgi:hypothetical protein